MCGDQEYLYRIKSLFLSFIQALKSLDVVIILGRKDHVVYSVYHISLLWKHPHRTHRNDLKIAAHLSNQHKELVLLCMSINYVYLWYFLVGRMKFHFSHTFFLCLSSLCPLTMTLRCASIR